MGVNNQLTSEGGALDLVITNVTVLDAKLGVDVLGLDQAEAQKSRLRKRTAGRVHDSRLMRGDKPFVFTNCLAGTGISEVVGLIRRNVLFDIAPLTASAR